MSKPEPPEEDAVEETATSEEGAADPSVAEEGTAEASGGGDATESESESESDADADAKPEAPAQAGADAENAESATTADGEESSEEEELPPLVPVLEAALFASAEAVPLTRLTRVLGAWTRKQVVAGLKELAERQEREDAGVRVVETAGGFQLRSVGEYAPWVRKFFAEKPPRLSRAVLETLAIVAYRQPATRGEIEAVRGVNCDAVLGALTARGLVQVIGRRQSPGRPQEYGTTPEFLELFTLKELGDLPPLPDPSSLANLIEEARANEEGEGEGAEGEGAEGSADGAVAEPASDGDSANELEPDGISDEQEAAGGDDEQGDAGSGGEAAEDPESGGDRVAAFGGGVDSGGESSGQREGDPRVGSEG